MKTAVQNLQGEHGSDTFADTTLHEGQWKAIKCLAAATFTVLTDIKDSSPDQSAFTMDKGDVWFGTFTEIHLATGAVKAFK